MANYNTLKTAIQQAVKPNGANEITGALLQSVLLAMVSNLGARFQFAGVATPQLSPGTPDYNVAYLAGPGTYDNMGGVIVPEGQIGIIMYNGVWSIQTVAVSEDVVKYVQQFLTPEQQAQARANIGAGTYTKPEEGIPSTDMAEDVQQSLDKANSAYQKPGDGIPSTDMAEGVRQSLGKANSAYQKPGTGIPSTDMTEGVRQSLGKADTAYQKPAGGIPKTDLASGVRTSLDKADASATQKEMDSVTAKIPTQASAQNQLADKSFVNSSIETNTATFRGTYNLVSDLGLTTAATQQQIAAALLTKVSTADKNDYVFVQVPTTDADPTVIARVDRYKYSGSIWSYEWSLNNSSFTAAQWAAINSGITSALVTKLSSLPSKPVSTAQQTLTATEKAQARTNIGATAPEIFWATYGTTTTSEIEAAINAGKILACKYNGLTYYQSNLDDSYVYFTHITSSGVESLLRVAKSNDTWGVINFALQVSNRSTSWGSIPSNDKYPSEKLAYDSIYPTIEGVRPPMGFQPNKPYDLGEISGSVTFTLDTSSSANIIKHYYWVFDTGATAPTITWPANISWVGSTPDIIANKHYEISIIDGVGVWMEA